MELRLRIELKFRPYRGRALPLSYRSNMEPHEGIEPSSTAYKAVALPLS